MDVATAAKAFAALGHQPRLEVFRLLVEAGPAGLTPSSIARTTGVVQNTLSTYLTSLAGAGLISSQRSGRSIIYTADFDGVGALLAYMVEDCCGGNPDLCAPAFAAIKAAVGGLRA